MTWLVIIENYFNKLKYFKYKAFALCLKYVSILKYFYMIKN